MNNSKEQIKSVFRSAAEEIREIIGMQETDDFVEKVSGDHGLSEEQSDNLADEVTLKLIGITAEHEFIPNLITRLNITSDVASDIAAKISGYLISKIPENVQIEQRKKAELILSGQNIQTESNLEIEADQISLASTVIVEKHDDLPMIIEKPVEIIQNKPFDAAQGKPKTALTFEERKKLVPNIPDNKSHYEGGVDPYREQF